MLKIIVVFVIICIGINYYVSAKGYKGPISDHFDGRKFFNITSSTTPVSKQTKNTDMSVGLLSFIVQKFKSSWGTKSLPTQNLVPAKTVLGKEIVVTFINHATVLIQTEGVNIITDPVWANRVSPFPFLGPKRHMDAGVTLDNLPKIDIILLSHNHYDHMDLDTLKTISQRDTPTIYTGLGNKEYLEKRDIKNVFEMDWGDRKMFSDAISIDSVPAQHFSARGLTDRNNTLWMGFVIRTKDGDIYFAGDTGYGPFVDRIKREYPNGFRLAFLPIGAYEPRSIMREVHMSPDDAVQIYKDLNVKKAVGIHFGTFSLSLENQIAPADRIKELLMSAENKNEDWSILWNSEVLDLK